MGILSSLSFDTILCLYHLFHFLSCCISDGIELATLCFTGITLDGLTSEEATQVGSMLFTRSVSGTRYDLIPNDMGVQDVGSMSV